MKEITKAVFQRVSLDDYRWELPKNAKLLKNGTVPFSAENSKMELGFTGLSWELRHQNWKQRERGR